MDVLVVVDMVMLVVAGSVLLVLMVMFVVTASIWARSSAGGFATVALRVAGSRVGLRVVMPFLVEIRVIGVVEIGGIIGVVSTPRPDVITLKLGVSLDEERVE